MKNKIGASISTCFGTMLVTRVCFASLTVCFGQPDQSKPTEPDFKTIQAKATKGDAAAQQALGTCYAYGKGAAKNAVEAAKWYRKAAELGNADAQYSLGWCYQNGEGVEAGNVDAVKWYRKAAEQGHILAQYSLGWCCQNGAGTDKSLVEAAKWYRKAAEQGHADAQYGLALYYSQGMAKNRVEAYKWAVLAAEQGYQDARKLRDDVERQMKPEQIAEVRKLADAIKSGQLSP